MAIETRGRLVAAAEQLFAERGIESVSLREIARSAGAKNVIAVQYHFTDRDGVLAAILDKHLPAVDASRHALLDAAKSEAALSMPAMAGALVKPLAAKLGDNDGGRAFLRVYADLLNHPTPALELAHNARYSSMLRWRALLRPVLDSDAAALHRRFTVLHYAAMELARHAETGPHPDDRLFTSHLVDMVTALLSAPLSDETRRLIRKTSPTRERAHPRATRR
ncbi:MAG: TetR/AcrR family transcriptional regulator [Mycobacterium sp.]